jgi:release factor glutamine methyltransferase
VQPTVSARSRLPTSDGAVAHAPPATVGAARSYGRQTLSGARAAVEADTILGLALGVGIARLVAEPSAVVPPPAARRFTALLARRAAGEPLAYVLGSAPFLDFDLEVGPGVLIPRPETEELAEWAIGRALSVTPPAELADVGTGSGALAIALARSVSAARVFASDTSAVALAMAQRSAVRLGVADRVRFERFDLLPADRQFDLVVANLPYVDRREMSLVAPDVRRFEPPEALFAGVGGLGLIRRLLRLLPQVLAPNGAVGLEIGWRQGPAVLELARSAFPRAAIRLACDSAGRDRYVHIEAGGK